MRNFLTCNLYSMFSATASKTCLDRALNQHLSTTTKQVFVTFQQSNSSCLRFDILYFAGAIINKTN